MTFDTTPTASIDEIAAASAAARTLVPTKWLKRQEFRRPSDPVLLGPNNALQSQKQISHAVSQKPLGRIMHPIAEAILVGERACQDQMRGAMCPVTNSLFRVLTLRDIANSLAKIENAESRVGKLTTAFWKSALFELLTAASYLPDGKPTLVHESSEATPDIRLENDFSIECKIRDQRPQEVQQFIQRIRREVANNIARTLIAHQSSHIVRLEVKSSELQSSDRKNIPEVVRTMMKDGDRIYETDALHIQIDTKEDAEISFQKPTSPFSYSFWEQGWDISDWADWHYALPFGEASYLDSDHRFATRAKRRNVILFRARFLQESRSSVRQTLKDACRRQLAGSRGIVHILVDKETYGIGKVRSEIEDHLRVETKKVMNEYGRLKRVVIDIYDLGGQFRADRVTTRRLLINL
jgi:hypothetical protein